MCICLCFDVSKAEVKKAIRDGYDSIEKLSDHIQVGQSLRRLYWTDRGNLGEEKSRQFIEGMENKVIRPITTEKLAGCAERSEAHQYQQVSITSNTLLNPYDCLRCRSFPTKLRHSSCREIPIKTQDAPIECIA